MKTKPSKKTPGHNVLFQGSRFILPEHRATINELKHQQMLRTKPSLDEQELELVASAISDSFMDREQITITLFDPVEYRLVIGIVTRIDQHSRQIRIDFGDRFEWVKMNDIIYAVVEDSI